MGEVHPGPLKLNRYILEALQDEGLVQVHTPQPRAANIPLLSHIT